MEKSQHTDLNKDMIIENASVACRNVRLWKLNIQKNKGTRLAAFEIKKVEKGSAGFVDSKENK